MHLADSLVPGSGCRHLGRGVAEQAYCYTFPGKIIGFRNPYLRDFLTQRAISLCLTTVGRFFLWACLYYSFSHNKMVPCNLQLGFPVSKDSLENLGPYISALKGLFSIIAAALPSLCFLPVGGFLACSYAMQDEKGLQKGLKPTKPLEKT